MKKHLIFLILVSLGHLLQAQDDELAKATQNPVADLYSLPFQNNTTYNNEPNGRAQNVLNIQPVIPLGIGSKFNLINRIIAPIITQPSPIADESSTGFGDINYTAFVSPKNVGKIIWGVGPSLQLPTASSSEFGSGEFGVGPSIVALSIINQWVAGVLVNNIWTFGDVKENKFLFQYFVNYNLPKAWYLVTAPIMTANWNGLDKQKWIVPFGGGAGKIVRLGSFPININAQVYYNVVRPDAVGGLQSRLQLQLLFPKK